MKKSIAHISNIISYEAEMIGVSVCELAAGMLTAMLMSESCDKCHIHWLELQSKLDTLISEASNENSNS